METRKINDEKIVYFDKCSECGKEITGTTKAMFEYNLKTHKFSKRCKRK